MAADPFVGVALHSIGGLAAASFYLPYKGVKRWSWETYWLVGGVFSWIVAPWVLAAIVCPQVLDILRESDRSTLLTSYGFGVMWGIGGLTFGLSMRYLGLSLGYAVALGLCAVFGTLIPPIFRGEFDTIISSVSGRWVLGGVAVCLGGIAVSGLAGLSKEKDLPAQEQRAVIAEFSLVKGLIVATIAGVLSAAMSYGIAAGKPISEAAVRHGTPDLWKVVPVLCVVLAGGFTTNFLWCIALNFRRSSGREYLAPRSGDLPVPLAKNYLLCALAGVTWYVQFMFYGMGTTKMGRYDFSSWSLHMASIIVFSTLWGIALHEWRGTGRRTRLLVALGLGILIVSMLVIGYGNYKASLSAS